ncbi:SDR family NAD(P)-dependent oxidoreductase [Natronorubrum halophilum]|uniref:SDR family NAD(P)-dependent oxidoreductase n=1 Tax=Natronorubrum halophilum TaxID=1702106 RepID=UPI000EF71A73|nr:SDR family NAD(P)-dependent oxidoreductase [Natronorubrum halophilum]
MTGTTAVVTGGTRGIGRAVAEAFVDNGTTVVIGARDGDAVAETVGALEERLEPSRATVAGVRTDVRDEFDLERLLETASRTGDSGGIDLVVPAAGVYHGESGATPTDRDSYSAFDDHWRINARGVFATILESLPHLNDGARVLVPTGSIAREAKPGYGSYAVSKATAEAVARGFAADTAYTVGCLDPGQVATELSGGTGRDPESVAGLFVWAALEAEPDEIDGSVVGLKEWKQATR